MSQEIQDCLDAGSASREEIVKLVRSLNESQLRWRPDDSSWSVRDCVEHLIIGATSAARVLEPAIVKAKGREQFGEGPFRYSFLGRKFLELLAPPPRPRFNAPKAFQPPASDTKTKDTLLSDFEASQDEVASVTESAAGLDLSKVKVPSPVSKLLCFNLGISLMITPIHQKRHYWQMRRIVEHSEFPQPLERERQ